MGDIQETSNQNESPWHKQSQQQQQQRCSSSSSPQQEIKKMEQITLEVEVASPQLARKPVAVVDIVSRKTTVQDHMINNVPKKTPCFKSTGAVADGDMEVDYSRSGRKQNSGRRLESKSGQCTKNKSMNSGQYLVDIDEIIAAAGNGSFSDTEFCNLSRTSTPNYDIKVSVAGLTLPLDEKTADTLRLNIDMHAAGERVAESPPSDKENPDSGQQRQKRNEPRYPICLKFVDVTYKVGLKGRKAGDKQVLKGVTGSVHPGEVLALLGPSGGGKTTLLNLLSGRVRTSASSGTITYNDQPYTKSLKQRIGYVLQDDVVYPHLTVKETLTYAARLRLPSTLTKHQKEERAMDVISELGLERCQDAVIGGTFLRGISGGERKRVCIGNEILINPSLLFLDEPTSGLDSTTALRIVQVLQKIAQGGKTVVTTIHQPSSRLFSKFDKLILLGNGTSLYSGKASEAMLYFSSIGCSPLIAMNPAEFLIDLANGNVTDKSIPSELKDNPLPAKGEPSAEEVHEYLVEAYQTKVATMEKKNLLKPAQVEEEVTTVGKANPREWGARWWDQFSILFWRGLKERRHDYLSWLRVTQVLATSIVLGLLWWNSDSSSPQQLQDQAGLLFFISVFWGFFPVFTSIFTFPQEKAMLSKERSVDMYRLSAYFMARNTSDLPLDLILPIVFMLIVYFMAGLKQSIDAFFLSILAILLCIVAAQGLGLAIGAAFMDVKKATTLASVTVMTFMLAGGFFVQRVPPFISWLRNLSFNYHTYRLLLKIQYGCSASGPSSKSCSSPFIQRLGLGNDGRDVAAMVAMIFGYRLLAYYFLRQMKLRTVN
ncbi:hypothetical protein H6P81_015732 [Aristolochia fimbriata]|uniref:ABC transporter domain-containing protein n=1 Tax=Aristolochia fimbriata TaxID=158543 RepID=A0AAV7E9H8_ARIFI|nr:hypothetical protein H6P81_015732 [Aristolochia fimbriata]